MDSGYKPPLALTIISSISIGLGALAALWIASDIVWRRGWRTMMWIMIPVYVINALYLWPITLWVYLKYGRPRVPSKGEAMPSHCAHHPPHAKAGGETEHSHDTVGGEGTNNSSDNGQEKLQDNDAHHNHHTPSHNGHHMPGHDMASHGNEHAHDDIEKDAADPHAGHGGHHDHHAMMADRPMFVTVTIGVCHCGAGCVLGDIIGEWLVYGTNATINGRMLWPEMLVDFAWALAFGIVFQYFSIAPMAGEYGIKTLVRAAKADVLSLVFFEIGLFAWMAAFQIGIFSWKIEMDNVTYWWMMQIGMFIGHWTGVPINWWLITKGIKEPCA